MGSKRVSLTSDPRLAITRKILRSIIKNASRLFPPVFEQTLFRVMHVVAFHALFRVGEYTVTDTSTHVIQFKTITFQVKGRLIVSFTIKLPHYMHSLKPATLNMSKSRVSAICQVVNLFRYCNLRGAKDGPLFLNLIKKMLFGSKRASLTSDPRLAIKRKILRSIIKNTSRLFPLVFEHTLFRVMYVVAFHALFRVGEYTSHRHINTCHSIQSDYFSSEGTLNCQFYHQATSLYALT